MKNLSIYALLFSLMFITSAFTPAVGEAEGIDATYTFTRSNEDAPLIQIKFNEDFSFTLIDRSAPRKDIQASGSYVIKGNRIQLDNVESTYPISRIWKLEKDASCIKTRRVLKITRICNC